MRGDPRRAAAGFRRRVRGVRGGGDEGLFRKKHRRRSLSRKTRLRTRLGGAGGRVPDFAPPLGGLFITAHPAMPLYAGVEAMRRDRAYLLSLGTDDFAELHVALSKLRVAPDWRPTRGEALDDDDDARARRRRSRLWRHSSRRRASCSERIPRMRCTVARASSPRLRARTRRIRTRGCVSTMHPSREMLYRTRRCLRRWFRV